MEEGKEGNPTMEGSREFSLQRRASGYFHGEGENSVCAEPLAGLAPRHKRALHMFLIYRHILFQSRWEVSSGGALIVCFENYPSSSLKDNWNVLTKASLHMVVHSLPCSVRVTLVSLNALSEKGAEEDFWEAPSLGNTVHISSCWFTTYGAISKALRSPAVKQLVQPCYI